MNELYSILISDDVITSINDNLDVILKLMPEIKNMIGFPHNHPHHHLDVWDHTLLALENSPKDFEIRIVLLLHDIGKPFSYQDEEIRHFKGHSDMSAIISYDILNRLGFEQDKIEEMCYLIKNHDNKITLEDIKGNRELEIKRFLVQYCDTFAHNPKVLDKRISYLKDVFNKLDDNNINTLVRKIL